VTANIQQQGIVKHVLRAGKTSQKKNLKSSSKWNSNQQILKTFNKKRRPFFLRFIHAINTKIFPNSLFAFCCFLAHMLSKRHRAKLNWAVHRQHKILPKILS
jgi:hypothetical protein